MDKISKRELVAVCPLRAAADFPYLGNLRTSFPGQAYGDIGDQSFKLSEKGAGPLVINCRTLPVPSSSSPFRPNETRARFRFCAADCLCR
jgi:hypothetical protein